MSTVTAQERVEILDSGSPVGWAEGVDGKWSCQLEALGVGSHTLTAKVKGAISGTWVVDVSEKDAVDDFNDMRIGNLQNRAEVRRAFYTLTPEYFNFSTASIQAAVPGWGGAGNCLQLYSHPEPWGMVTVRLVFDKLCSEVSLDCKFEVLVSNGGAGFALLRANQAGGKWIDHHLFTNRGSFAGPISVKSSAKDIANVQLILSGGSGDPVYSTLRWSLDNLKLKF